ncbi:hypothetical protein DFR58_102113 [Anaerobacterium chartisolvens]|uniref:Flagellar hook-length control protein-like C-terminal domain-containing protein n=1 Tax=Anaerobacterium chartisolvens TaxID=1297424 RepID=A0A369BK21_9FIRM|nr:flagellar hook-length control protein FliK [Anaerobacterium chartisolvens]RCX20044.1 hypothetical protein DFR58_102113 [Anaerobacterium chartisolvens]
MRVDTLVQGHGINAAVLSKILERLNTGDIVRAQILDMTSSDLLLKLFDGSEISASVAGGSENIDAKPGEFIELAVKGKNDNQLILEQLKNGETVKADQTAGLKAVIKDLGLPASARNMEIAKEIQSNNLSLNKETFEKITDALMRFKDVNAAKAAFLIANKLGIEEKNINALKQLTDLQVKISGSVRELLVQIDNIKDDNIIKDIADRLISLDKQGIHAAVQAKNASAKASNADLLMNALNLGLEREAPQTGKGQGPSSEALIKLMDKVKAAVGQSRNVNQSVLEKTISSLDKLMEGTRGAEASTLERAGVLKDSLVSVLNALRKAGAQNKELQGHAGDKTGGGIKPDEGREIIRQSFERLAVKIEPDGLKGEINVKKLYRELLAKLDVLKDAAGLSGLMQKNEIASRIDNIENNIRFMNQLNNCTTYIQIPVSMPGGTATGELYVLKRDPKRKRIDPDNVTMLVSLNTENIGKIDSLIGVNKKNITLSVRASDERVIDFIKGYHKDLYERLCEKGFKLVDFKVRKTEEDPHLMNAERVAGRELELNKGSIDFRL